MKKILHIITRLDKGGSAENVILTARKLDKSVYDTRLVYGSTVLPALSINVPVIEIPYLVRSISPYKDFRAFWKLYSIISNEKPDIIHTHSSKAGFLGRFAAWLYNFTARNRAVVIHTPHGHVFYGYEFGKMKTDLFIMLEKIAALASDKLIALTKGERRESLEFGIGTPKQWEVVHSAVANSLLVKNAEKNIRHEYKIPLDSVVVGTVARLEKVKGIEYFINAIGELSTQKYEKPVYFVIVGDGQLRVKLEKLTKKLNISDKVIFAGMREDVLEIMEQMDIFVQPSLNEGMGKTIVQAQSLGVAVIATNVQGIPDVVKDGEMGILVPPSDYKMLANAISQLIQNSSLRLKFGEAGKKYVEEIVDGFPRYSLERMIKLLENIYQTALIQ